MNFFSGRVPLIEFDATLKANSDRVVNLAAKEHDQALLHLLRDYQVQFRCTGEGQPLLLPRAVAYDSVSTSLTG
jgi:hypothetical protein